MDARTAALDNSAPRPLQSPAVKVAVLVDLTWGPRAGGHVKCWERLATAAARFAGGLECGGVGHPGAITGPFAFFQASMPP